MANTLICPLCRSLLQLHGHIDFNAPELSHPVCPACGYPEDIPSGFPVPMKWDSVSILQYNKPIKTYAELVALQPGVADTTRKLATGDNAKSIYSGWDAGAGLSNSLEYFFKSVTSVAGQGVGGAVKGTIEGTVGGLSTGLTGNSFALPLAIFAVIFIILLMRK